MDPKNLIEIPGRVYQTRGHSHSSDDTYGAFETITGAHLWELSEIELPETGRPSEVPEEMGVMG